MNENQREDREGAAVIRPRTPQEIVDATANLPKPSPEEMAKEIASRSAQIAAVEDILGAPGGPLFAVERLLWWWMHYNPALEERELFSGVVREFSRRLRWYVTGWDDQEGFQNSSFEAKRIRNLDAAFKEAKDVRASAVGKVALRPGVNGLRGKRSVYHAVTNWAERNPEKTLEAAFESLAGSDQFPRLGSESLRAAYKEAASEVKNRTKAAPERS